MNEMIKMFLDDLTAKAERGEVDFAVERSGLGKLSHLPGQKAECRFYTGETTMQFVLRYPSNEAEAMRQLESDPEVQAATRDCFDFIYVG